MCVGGGGAVKQAMTQDAGNRHLTRVWCQDSCAFHVSEKTREELAQSRRTGRTVPNEGREQDQNWMDDEGDGKTRRRREIILAQGLAQLSTMGQDTCCQPEKSQKLRGREAVAEILSYCEAKVDLRFRRRQFRLAWRLRTIRGRPGLWDWAEGLWNPGP